MSSLTRQVVARALEEGILASSQVTLKDINAAVDLLDPTPCIGCQEDEDKCPGCPVFYSTLYTGPEERRRGMRLKTSPEWQQESKEPQELSFLQ